MKMNILFRKGLEEEGEFESANKHFNVYEYRSQLPSNQTIIGRYSVLPYYSELENELKLKNSKLINSYNEHLYVADIKNWYPDFSYISPKTWFEWPDLEEGKYVVKGRTNSRKHQWNKRMFADSKEKLNQIVNSLLDDCLINEQGLCVRQFVPLETYDYGINELPITNEWRFFFYKENLIDFGYYWSFYENKNKIDDEAIKLAKDIAKKASKNINFFVIDLAKTKDKEWILIEFNDGQMSGLSSINPFSFYGNLFRLTEL